MLKLEWRMEGEVWLGCGASGEDLWRIEPAPASDAGWVVNGLRDLGYYSTLSMAVAVCERVTPDALSREEARVR